MEIRYASHPDDFETYTTARMRKEFLVGNLFTPGKIALTYSHNDRMIVGGVCPQSPLKLTGGKELGTGFFLERREMGVINVGPKGSITVDGQRYDLEFTDLLYIGQGSREIVFQSDDPAAPSHFYLNSGMAHSKHPTAKCTKKEANSIELGSGPEANARVLNQYIHPDVVPSCNLVMGVTDLVEGSVWNTMPCHTHERRMEVYFYFNLPQDALVMHFMGRPEATRNLVVRNEEAVISPPWSIHSGCGTRAYSFIWGMVGDNQTFTDMDGAGMAGLT